MIPSPRPRPLGPVHDLADHLGEGVRSSLRDARQPHEIFAAVFDHLPAQPVACSSSTTCTGRTRARSTCCASCSGASGRRARLVVGTLRDDEIGADAPAAGAARRRRPLGRCDVDVVAPAERRRRSRTLAGGPAGRRRSAPAASPAATRSSSSRCSTTTATSSRARCATPSSPARPSSTPSAWDLLHLLACAPEAIPDHLLAAARHRAPAAARRRRRRADPPRAPRRRVPPRPVPAARSRARSHPVARWRCTAGCSTRWRRPPRADPAVLAHHAVGAGDRVAHRSRYATEAGRAAARSGAHTQAAAFFRIALEQGRRLAPAERGRAARAAGRRVLPHRPPRRRDRRQRTGDGRCASAAGDLAGVSANHHALSVYHWYNADRDDAERHADAAVAVLDGGPTALGRRPRPPRPRARRCRRTSRCTPATSTAPGRCSRRAAEIAEPARDDPTLTVRVGLIEGICDVLEGDGAGRERDAVDPRRGRRAARRDLLERLQQPHLPRRRAAAASPTPPSCSASACR